MRQGGEMATLAGRRLGGLAGTIDARPPIAFRIAVGICRFLARVVFDFRLELRGAEHLPRTSAGQPAGGWIAVALPHRHWIDPFILLLLLPVEPRVVFLGDGRALVHTRLRRILFMTLGGVVPIWPRRGRKAFAEHVDACRGALDAGAVFAIFPEAGPPSAPDRARSIQAGVGYLALRAQAAIVPLVIGGTRSLYRGRRLVLEALPPMTARQLASLGDADPMPEAGTAEERRAAHRISGSLQELTAPKVAALHREVERASAHDRPRWTWLTGWLDWDADADRPTVHAPHEEEG